MQEPILIQQEQQVYQIVFNRVEKHNAFDDNFIEILQQCLDDAAQNPEIHLVVLRANGAHFSAGADLNWMQRMVNMSEAENLIDAQKLANLLHTLYHLPKPTLSLVHGSAFGGGVGLIAATDLVLASESAQFCFSEIKLGLIPAVISPFVIEAIGARAAMAFFMTGETFSAQRAFDLQLVHRLIPDARFDIECEQFITHMTRLPVEALRLTKTLVRRVKNKAIDGTIQDITAPMIAERRTSKEGQRGILAFLNKVR